MAGFSLLETLVTLGVAGIIAAIAVPMMANSLGYFRLSGDARSISNGISLAKMRAASSFSQVRFFVDLSGHGHRLETWDKSTSTWTAEGGTTYLSTGVAFGFGTASNAPPNTQATIGQAPSCRTNAGDTIANTACVVFNSRGVPIDSNGVATALDAMYVTDGTSVYSATVSATGMVRSWRTGQSTTSWILQ